MIGKRFRSLPFIFANDNYTLRNISFIGIFSIVRGILLKELVWMILQNMIIFTLPMDISMLK